MKKQSKLSEAEWELMTEIWRLGKPVSVREVHERLYPNKEKAYTTVQTTMNILFDKNFLRRDKVGLVNFYFPTLSQREFAKRETSSFVFRLFNGSFGALANYLVDSGELSDEELNELKTLIDEREKENGGKP